MSGYPEVCVVWVGVSRGMCSRLIGETRGMWLEFASGSGMCVKSLGDTKGMGLGKG